MNTICVPESKVTLRLKTAMINKPSSLKIRTEKDQWTITEDGRVLRGMMETWCLPWVPVYNIYTAAKSAAT